ncbi:5-formyltetrahydrofolate cyclo-ligase [Marinomonas sp. C2222]|uniref:5-formyltetrahydrofolate cyclo-ligase n=1 Tax=Marinomonas sargassi TaxID=2984494 RepID=A0ABT2YVI1_9GAMM|nr:5-formyltetrahydrofolate cyclo-ligase [Marinomonas sargassi]MCV2403894.1 5-formyltetrahydrofolate cyclo-ligase [Marinomonas sargassi]
MTHTKESRQQLRQQLRQARRSLSTTEQANAAKHLVKQFQDNLQPLLINSPSPKKVALYLANDGEICPQYLCEFFWQSKIQTYLPVIDNQELKFAVYTESSQWQSNQYGIKEPVATEYLSPHDLDLVFLPLVGFDKQGGRLGMGGGFYDRTFANKKVHEEPLLIGLAHNCQQVDELPIESWDVPLQAILTPSSFIETKT